MSQKGWKMLAQEVIDSLFLFVHAKCIVEQETDGAHKTRPAFRSLSAFAYHLYRWLLSFSEVICPSKLKWTMLARKLCLPSLIIEVKATNNLDANLTPLVDSSFVGLPWTYQRLKFRYLDIKNQFWSKLPWVPEVFSRVWRGDWSAVGWHVFGQKPKRRAARPREKSSGAERLDLPC